MPAPRAPVREQVKDVNAGSAKLADDRQVAFPGSGKKFLEPDGTPARSLFPDLLHPTEQGGRIRADAMNPAPGARLK
jgi:hypothetical protein